MKEILERLRKKRILEEERKYVEESIRLDREDYIELLDEERTLHKELETLRKRLDKNGRDEFLKEVIVGTLREISENADTQVQVLESIRGKQAKLQFSFRILFLGYEKYFYERILRTTKVPTPTPMTMGMVFFRGLTSTISFSSMIVLGASSFCGCFSSILRFEGIFVILS